MTRIESEELVIKKASAEIFTDLSDFNNFEKIMPEQVVNWTSSSDACTFTIKNMASLGMRIKEKTPNSKIVIERDGKAPFDFVLYIDIADAGEGMSNLKLAFDADLNPFLKM